MYIVDSPDIRYWESVSKDAHRWRNVLHQTRVSMRRRSSELGQPFPREAYNELLDATRVFDVRYHYALAQADAAHVGKSLDEVLAA